MSCFFIVHQEHYFVSFMNNMFWKNKKNIILIKKLLISISITKGLITHKVGGAGKTPW